MLDMNEMFEQVRFENEIRANRIAEAKRVADIRERTREAVLDAVGVQPCGVQDCSVHARYFSSRNQYCENHMAIKGLDIFKKVQA
jgi:hypothetical protein